VNLDDIVSFGWSASEGKSKSHREDAETRRKKQEKEDQGWLLTVTVRCIEV